MYKIKIHFDIGSNYITYDKACAILKNNTDAINALNDGMFVTNGEKGADFVALEKINF